MKKTETLLTIYAGPKIEAAWNPARRRQEPIYAEDEGYDEATRSTLYWCGSAGRYVSVPVNA